ncbi:hypothetical protein [Serratia inhibens]|uniref:hypothetical protein n=1 Tax=Serratia inhibens TaxID=2338073 RepID=UPI003216391D
MVKRRSKQQELQTLQQHLLQTLDMLSPPIRGAQLPPPAEWPSTRQLAEPNDINIYKARVLLLNLVDSGKILVTKGTINKSLRWYPSVKHS